MDRNQISRKSVDYFMCAITRAQDRLYLLGRNGIHGPDFFGECLGEETTLIDYFANKKEQTEKNEKLIIEMNEVKACY